MFKFKIVIITFSDLLNLFSYVLNVFLIETEDSDLSRKVREALSRNLVLFRSKSDGRKPENDEENCIYDEIDRLTIDHDYKIEKDISNEGLYCPGCIFLNSRGIASQWINNPNSYSPKMLPCKHSADQCSMKDIVMDLVFQSKLNIRFYSKQDYLYAELSIPQLTCERFFGT